MLNSFSCACWPSVYLLWKMSSQSLCPFFGQVVCFLEAESMHSLCTLDINPSSTTSFANSSSHQEAAFSFFDSFLHCAKAFYLFIYIFICIHIYLYIFLSFYFIFLGLFIYLFIYFFLRAAPTAYGGSQARGLMGTVAASLLHSHSNARSELCLQPTPQLMGNAGSLTHWTRPGIKPTSSRILAGFINPWARTGTLDAKAFQFDVVPFADFCSCFPKFLLDFIRRSTVLPLMSFFCSRTQSTIYVIFSHPVSWVSSGIVSQ